ncbi:E3 ubiquitin-protein ligase RLIM [Platysternon megacephalum]|uniref:E3 ubiquitin-protein ligase RLIM n=1 Tax=Platysternon megacephalum TaxID=55544 RepID=A0A4D9EY64_9SAUR|nr:E3 ubiquitin-protein ligase RLIM [Platysternon megacephalum]
MKGIFPRAQYTLVVCIYPLVFSQRNAYKADQAEIPATSAAFPLIQSAYFISWENTALVISQDHFIGISVDNLELIGGKKCILLGQMFLKCISTGFDYSLKTCLSLLPRHCNRYKLHLSILIPILPKPFF